MNKAVSKKINLFFGLRLKLMLVVIVGIVISFAPLALYSLKRSQNKIEQEILSSGQERVQLAAESLSNLLIAYDYSNMESLAQRIVKLQDVQQITITNSSGKIMTSRSQKDAFSKADSRHFERPILFDGTTIGKVEILISPQRLYKKLQVENESLVIMLCLFAFFLGTLIYVAISIVIVKPIGRFRDLMMTIVNNPTELTLVNLQIKSQDEIGELASVFNEMNEKVYGYQKILKEKNILTGLELAAANQLLIQSSKMAILGEMAGNIAHEINNPLTIISGKSEKLIRLFNNEGIIEEGGKQSIILPELVKIRETAKRIAKIIRGLKTFSRNGDKDPFSLTKLTSIIDVCLDLCRERMSSNEVSFFIPEFADLEVECRDSQIVQVIVNLLSNAIDAVIPLDEKWIKLEVKVVTNQWVHISVTDSGKGIDPELAEKIIEPFFTTKEKEKGTGLGLSISNSIALDHQGALIIDNHSPNTCFVLKIPITQKLMAV